MNKKKIFLSFVCIIIFLSFNFIIALANTDVRDNIKNQDVKLEENIKIQSDKLNDEFINNFIKQSKESDGTYKGNTIIKNIKNAMSTFIFKSREYIIYSYILIMMLDVIIIAYVGSKSLEVRRKYIYRGLWTTFIFLIFINIPLFVAYYQNRIEPFRATEILAIIKGTIDFFNTNALVLCFLVYLMGIFYNITNDNNVSNIMKARFLKKTAGIAFLILKLAPLALNIFI